MLVRELMSTDVVTVPVDATLDTAVERLLDQGVGSVVVVDGDGDPLGIVTETDALRAARKTDAALSEIDIRDVGHRPVVTTDPETSVASVARTMAAEGVKKIPVVDGLDLVGIVTLTDVVWHLSDLRSESMAMTEARERWQPN